MGDWATYPTLEALLDDVRTRFRETEKQGTSCSLKLFNGIGVYALLVDKPNPEEAKRISEILGSVAHSIGLAGS